MSLDFSRTAAFLDGAVEQGAFPDYQAAAGSSRGIFFSRSTGEGLFDMASLTKFMAAAMTALGLMDRKELRPEDTLARYCDAPPDKSTLTIEQLMTHTAGFSPHWLLEESCSSPDEAIESILTRPLDYVPGTRVEYSCMGYILLGKILEKVGGAGLDRLAGELVFQPLGMTRTGFLPVGENVPPGRYLPTEHGLTGVVHDENARFLGGVSANAGLFSCAEDTALFAAMLLRQGEGFLRRETFREFLRNRTPDLNKSRGLGIEILKEGESWPAGHRLSPGSYGHTGFTGTSLYIDPARDLFFILLTNRVNLGRDLQVMPGYRAQFHESLLKEGNFL